MGKGLIPLMLLRRKGLERYIVVIQLQTRYSVNVFRCDIHNNK